MNAPDKRYYRLLAELEALDDARLQGAVALGLATLQTRDQQRNCYPTFSQPEGEAA